MVLNVTHTFVSAKIDGPDTTQVQPSDWNENHTLEMATARLLGRTTAAAGPVEELSVGATLLLSAGVLSLATNPAVAGNLAVAGTLAVTGTTQLTGAVGVGGAAVASAALDIQSTTKGALFPRMTTVQRDAIGSPATGLVIYNTTTGQLEVKHSGAWGAVTTVALLGAQPLDGDLTELAAPTYVRGDLIRRGATVLERVPLGASGTILTSDGTDPVWGTGFAPTEVASASLTGASVNLFTGLPSGVKRINVWARNVSLDAGANYAGIQIGTGGSFVTSGYDSASGNRGGEFTSTARFLDMGSNASAATVYDVAFELRKFAGGNVWLCKHQGTIQGSTPFHGFGNLTLAGEIDRIRYNASGANFDGGFIFAEWFGY